MVKKDNKGITLIALIITVIVLLILAGVTMSFVVGDNGVVTQAQKSRIRTDEVSAKEEVEMEVAGSYNDKGVIDLETLNKNLNNLSGIKLKKKDATETEEAVYEEFSDTNKIESLPATVQYKGTEINIEGKTSSDGDSGSGGITAKEIEENPKEYYGKYVEYGLELSGDNDHTNDWKIFYTDEKQNRIFLIAADYVPNENTALKIAINDEHAKMTQYNGDGYRCRNYWDQGSLPVYNCYDGIDDEYKDRIGGQCSFPNIFMPSGSFCINGHYYCSSHASSAGRCAASLQCTENWSSFKTGYGEYAIGGPTIEMWVASWNKVHGREDGIALVADGCNNEGKGYRIGVDGSSTKSSIALRDYEGYNDTLYFPHHVNTNLNLFSKSNDYDERDSGGKYKCNSYWLSSRADGDIMYVFDVDAQGEVDGMYYNNGDPGVRPVVSLEPEMRLEKVTDGDQEFYKIKK